MRRMVMAGAGALAMMAVAGCAETNSWFGSGNTASDPTSGSTVTAPRGTSGTSMGGDAVGTGIDADGTAADGTVIAPQPDRRSRTDSYDRMRDRPFSPGTLSGTGRWTNESDAPGGN